MDFRDQQVREAEEKTKQALARVQEMEARVEETNAQIALAGAKGDSLDVDAEQARSHDLAMRRESERTKRTAMYVGALVILGVAAMVFL